MCVYVCVYYSSQSNPAVAVALIPYYSDSNDPALLLTRVGDMIDSHAVTVWIWWLQSGELDKVYIDTAH